MEIVQFLITTILYVMAISLIPFVWWLVSGRKKCGFFKWLGITKPVIANKKKYLFSFLTVILISVLIISVSPLVINGSKLASSQFAGKGIEALLPVLIFAFLQTGLAEEILFRGFLAKRLMNKLGFFLGNLIQAVLFGFMHGVLFFAVAGWIGALIITLLTAFLGWILCWINEKQSGGSILSSWFLHGCANTISALLAMFSIL